MRVLRGSPALSDRVESDIASIELDGKSCPEHDPFVGRLKDLAALAKLPSAHADGKLVQTSWASGDAGMGKSALLRQHACHVRDSAFADSREPVWLLHAYCQNCVQPRDVERLICEKAKRLYAWDAPLESFHELFKRLASVAGTHVWILDDLTYLRPEIGKDHDSAQTAQTIAGAAKTAAVALQLVVSARFAGPPGWTPLRVAALTEAEALDLARRVRLQASLGLTNCLRILSKQSRSTKTSSPDLANARNSLSPREWPRRRWASSSLDSNPVTAGARELAEEFVDQYARRPEPELAAMVAAVRPLIESADE